MPCRMSRKARLTAEGATMAQDLRGKRAKSRFGNNGGLAWSVSFSAGVLVVVAGGGRWWKVVEVIEISGGAGVRRGRRKTYWLRWW